MSAVSQLKLVGSILLFVILLFYFFEVCSCPVILPIWELEPWMTGRPTLQIGDTLCCMNQGSSRQMGSERFLQVQEGRNASVP